MDDIWELWLEGRVVGRVGRDEEGAWFAMALDSSGNLSPIAARHDGIKWVNRWRTKRAVQRALLTWRASSRAATPTAAHS